MACALQIDKNGPLSKATQFNFESPPRASPGKEHPKCPWWVPPSDLAAVPKHNSGVASSWRTGQYNPQTGAAIIGVLHLHKVASESLTDLLFSKAE